MQSIPVLASQTSISRSNVILRDSNPHRSSINSTSKFPVNHNLNREYREEPGSLLSRDKENIFLGKVSGLLSRDISEIKQLKGENSSIKSSKLEPKRKRDKIKVEEIKTVVTKADDLKLLICPAKLVPLRPKLNSQTENLSHLSMKDIELQLRGKEEKERNEGRLKEQSLVNEVINDAVELMIENDEIPRELRKEVLMSAEKLSLSEIRGLSLGSPTPLLLSSPIGKNLAAALSASRSSSKKMNPHQVQQCALTAVPEHTNEIRKIQLIFDYEDEDDNTGTTEFPNADATAQLTKDSGDTVLRGPKKEETVDVLTALRNYIKLLEQELDFDQPTSTSTSSTPISALRLKITENPKEDAIFSPKKPVTKDVTDNNSSRLTASVSTPSDVLDVNSNVSLASFSPAFSSKNPSYFGEILHHSHRNYNNDNINSSGCISTNGVDDSTPISQSSIFRGFSDKVESFDGVNPLSVWLSMHNIDVRLTPDANNRNEKDQLRTHTGELPEESIFSPKALTTLRDIKAAVMAMPAAEIAEQYQRVMGMHTAKRDDKDHDSTTPVSQKSLSNAYTGQTEQESFDAVNPLRTWLGADSINNEDKTIDSDIVPAPSSSYGITVIPFVGPVGCPIIEDSSNCPATSSSAREVKSLVCFDADREETDEEDCDEGDDSMFQTVRICSNDLNDETKNRELLSSFSVIDQALEEGLYRGNVTVDVVNYNIAADHVKYEISVKVLSEDLKSNVVCLSVNKRYRDFVCLHQSLVSLGINVQNFPAKQRIPKVLFFWDRWKSVSFINKRKTELYEWLRSTLWVVANVAKGTDGEHFTLELLKEFLM